MKLLDILSQRGDMSIRELAQALKIKESSVSSAITRARRQLKNGDRIITIIESDGLLSWVRYQLVENKGQMEAFK